MGMYRISFSPQALKDVSKLQKSEPMAFKKLSKLVKELEENPKIGTGKPKPLGGNRAGQWSRRITDKHRLVYEIKDEEVLVLVLSSWGHYDDK